MSSQTDNIPYYGQTRQSPLLEKVINQGDLGLKNNGVKNIASIQLKNFLERNKTDISLRYNKSEKLSATMRMIKSLLKNFTLGNLTIYLDDGQKIEHFTNNRTNDGTLIEAEMFVHKERCFRRFLTGGSLGICEAYIDGDFDTPNLTALYTLCLVNEHAIEDVILGNKWSKLISKIIHALRPNTRKGSKKNISAHYDLGNDFYSLWLDKSMTYSSALFTNENMGLEDAQYEKYEALCREINLKKGEHVLEIGCGWGGFAEYAALRYDAKVTALTISNEQYEFAKNRIKKAGLEHLVEIRFQDYRDVTETFDKIVSIEMFEAVGESYWTTYFEAVKKYLKPQGKASLQIITIDEKHFDEYRKKGDYIQKYIFPGGMLPTKEKLTEIVKQSDLKEVSIRSFGHDYAQTLMNWNDRFQQNWIKALMLGFDNKFKRTWEQYFAYCAAGFLSERIDVVHLTLEN